MPKGIFLCRPKADNLVDFRGAHISNANCFGINCLGKLVLVFLQEVL